MVLDLERENLFKRRKRIGKKGSLVDIVFIAVMFFAFVIVCLVGATVLRMYNNQTGGSDVLSEGGQNITRDAEASYGAVFDGIMTFMMIGLAVALLVSVMLIKTHPGFLWVSLFLMIIFSVLFFVLQEAWKDVSEDQLFANTTNATAQFPITSIIMDNYLTIFIVIGIMGIIVMYAKFGGGWN